ncbi:SAM-dependent methyltransferase [Nonomuraea sp. NPDC023979]|uniref:SAM-dependent methyltransferase n=1 Tax=Nonomuraea sp. NPDC023979 TaxID=3154796 RepID=UPI0033FD6320
MTTSPSSTPDAGGNIPSTPARIYSALSPTGRDHFAADLDAAAALDEALPEWRLIAQSNRQCLGRMVAYAVELTDQDSSPQVLDISAGLPDQPPNVHEVAQRARPDARCVYVDHDEQVCVDGRALLREEGVAMVEADLRESSRLLAEVEKAGLVDFSRPVIVVMGAVLHFLDDGQAEEALTVLHDHLAPGSLLLATHATRDVPCPPDWVEAARALYERPTGQALYLRTRQRIGKLLLPWGPLHPPGLTTTETWHPYYATAMVEPAPYFLAGVAGPR